MANEPNAQSQLGQRQFMNLAFHYLYRDESNNIAEGVYVFSNPEGFSSAEALSRLEKLLIDGVFFIPNAIGIPTLYNTTETDDHDYHEAEGLEETETAAQDNRSFKEFLKDFEVWKRSNADEYW